MNHDLLNHFQPYKIDNKIVVRYYYKFFLPGIVNKELNDYRASTFKVLKK